MIQESAGGTVVSSRRNRVELRRNDVDAGIAVIAEARSNVAEVRW